MNQKDDVEPFCCEMQAYLLRNGWLVRGPRPRRTLSLVSQGSSRPHLIALRYCPMCGTPLRGARAGLHAPGTLLLREGLEDSESLAIVIHNDDVTTTPAVRSLLVGVFGLDPGHAQRLIDEVDKLGVCEVAVLPAREAEQLAREALRAAREDRQPLKITLRPPRTATPAQRSDERKAGD